MLRARSALCLIVLAACSDGGMTGAEKKDEPIDAPPADAPQADAPASGSDAALPAPDAPSPDGCVTCACVPAAPTIIVSPQTSPPTAAGTEAAFDVAVTDNDLGACAATRYEMRTRLDAPLFQVVPTNLVPLDTGPLHPGETKHLTITAVPTEAFAGQTITIPFDLIEPATTQVIFQNFVQLEVADPTGCHVSVPRELMITDVSVVDDPVRTGFADPADPRTGVWTFKHLVEEMAPTPAEAPAMVEAMFASYTVEQTINGFVVPPRPGFGPLLLAIWPRLPGGELDLRAAPVRLLAIVNRFDLRNLAQGDAGEGRFVFEILEDDLPAEATIIFEYKLPAANANEVLQWAQDFHTVGGIPFSETYNDALQSLITDVFTRRGARPSGTNGSAINAVRTNEIAFGDDGNWELREFALSPATGMLEPRPVDLTPDVGLNGSDTLARFVNANAATILLDQHVTPDVFEGARFRGGAVINDGSVWSAPGILDPEARFHFSENTCNGCHGPETGTNFLQIGLRTAGFQSHLSGFLLGKTVTDPVTGARRTLNDLARRRDDLTPFVCPPAGAALAPANLARGIQRVH